MIAIIDYDMGNIKSVSKALEKLGYESVITCDKAVIDQCDAMILPGVGAFADAIKSIKDNGLDIVIKDNVKKGKLLIGICLGMQLLFDKSYEDGEYEGLGLIEGEIVRFDNTYKVPHMGWNKLIKNKEDNIGNDVTEDESVYFVHSYFAKPKNKEDVVYYAEYGVDVPAVVRNGNVLGMQFHPEKSSTTGLKLLKNFGELIK